MNIILVFEPRVEVHEGFICQGPIDLGRVVVWDVEVVEGDEIVWGNLEEGGFKLGLEGRKR